MSLTIGDGMVVSTHYTLTDNDSTVLDSTDESEPMVYLHGAENLIPGLEDALAGKTVGDKFKVSIDAEDDEFELIVVKHVEGNEVTIDSNHPLAGLTLNFDVEVIDIREASSEEIEHEHVH